MTERIRLTKQRAAILETVRESDHHLTASEVFDAAKAILPGISFATVYNSLHFLKEEGLIGEIRLANGACRFDRITSRHDHAICEECGKLEDIALDLPQSLVDNAIAVSGFQSRSIELTLRGLCNDCNHK